MKSVVIRSIAGAVAGVAVGVSAAEAQQPASGNAPSAVPQRVTQPAADTVRRVDLSATLSPRQAGMEPVEQGVGDVSVLGTSMRRDFNIDLRSPTDFDRVYRLPAPVDAMGRISTRVGGGEPEMLVRMSGALTAVFPRSVYDTSDGGLTPQVPAGTIYYVGRPPLAGSGAARREGGGLAGAGRPWHVAGDATRLVTGAAATGGAVGQAGTRVNTMVGGGARAGGGGEPVADRSGKAGGEARATERTRVLNVLTDEEFCRDRVKQVLLEAAGGR